MMARPTRYDPERTPKLAKALAREGRTDVEIADLLGLSERVIYNWKKRYPAFVQALNAGKSPVDDSVENALLKRALGFEVEDTKVIGRSDGHGGVKAEKVEKTKKQVSPDTTACIFWLKNRRPGVWRDRQEITGAEGGPVTLIMREVAHGGGGD